MLNNTYLAVPFDQPQQDRARVARAAIGDIATQLRAIERGASPLVRLYCKWCGYDLAEAFLALNGLRLMAGSPQFDDSTRKNNLDLPYVSLNAHNHLTAEQIATLRNLVAESRQQQEDHAAN